MQPPPLLWPETGHASLRLLRRPFGATTPSLRSTGSAPRKLAAGWRSKCTCLSTSNYADLSRFTHVTGHWRVFESGAAVGIYDDVPTDTDDLAFTEEVGGIASSNRLGFGTMAKRVSDDDCAEATDGTGFTCDLTALREPEHWMIRPSSYSACPTSTTSSPPTRRVHRTPS